MVIITHLMAPVTLWLMPSPHLLALEETLILMKMKHSLSGQILVSYLYSYFEEVFHAISYNESFGAMMCWPVI